MAADTTQAVQVVTLGSGFQALPVPIPTAIGVVATVIDLKATETGGGAGSGPARPTTGILYPRGRG